MTYSNNDFGLADYVRQSVGWVLTQHQEIGILNQN